MSLTAEQLEMRRTGITATDATAIVGVNPYRTPYDVYTSKVAPANDSAPNAKQSLGHRLEPIALDLLAEQRGFLWAPSTTVRHPILTWALATPDALVSPRLDPGHIVGVAEAKAVGFRMAHHWGDEEDDLPDYVRVQVAWQMGVTKLPYAYVVALIGTDARFYTIEHDEDLWCALTEACDRFWRERVLAKKMPDPDGSEASARMVRALFPRQKLDMLLADGHFESVAREYLEAREAIKAAEVKKRAAEAILCSRIGEHEGVEGNGWRAFWKWRDPVEVKAHVREGARAFDLREVKSKKGRVAA